MTSFKLWVKAVRAPFFTATVIPVALGALLAWHNTGGFLWGRFWLTLIGALFIHAGTNLSNDYFDHLRGNDEANSTPTPFSGGSRVIQERLIAPRKILHVSLALFAAGAATGLYLNHISAGNAVLVMGILGVSLGFFYTAGPFRIGYRGGGEAAAGIGFGPLVVMGAYYVQAQALSMNAFFISLPVGLLIALVLFINEFPDYEADRSVGKLTAVVLMGKERAVALYRVLLAGVYALIIALVFSGSLPATCLIALATIPLFLKAFTVSGRNFDRIHEMLPANASTIALHSAIGSLLCAGLILNKLFFGA